MERPRESEAEAPVPGIFLFLCPRGERGATLARGVAEFKVIENCLVIPLRGPTLFAGTSELLALGRRPHVTVHQNLMVHAKGKGATVVMRGGVARSQLRAPRHLVTIGTGAPTLGDSAGRWQRRFHGACVVGAAADEGLQPTTQLLVDLWALPESWTNLQELPSVVPKTRPVRGHTGQDLGPYPGRALLGAESLPCKLHFRFWLGEPDSLGRPVIAGAEQGNGSSPPVPTG
jgi:hypothetical protein